MRAFLSATALLLALHGASAGISLSVTFKDTVVKDLSSLNLEGNIEATLADDVVVGGTYSHEAAVAKPEEVYFKKGFETGAGDLKIDARYNLPENLGKLSATLKRKADFIRATFSTTRRVVDKVVASKSFTLPGERQLSVTPTFCNQKRSFTVELKQDIQAGKTDAVLFVSQEDKDLELTVNHKVDDRNIISPTLSLKKGYVTYGWKHLLGEGGELTAVLDPFEDLDLTWTDPGKAGSWVANARIPVKEPRTASVSFKRKFAFN